MEKKTKEDLLLEAVQQNLYPQFLNKYRSDSDNTRKIITQNKLWFSNPHEFNDPYDCNTPITTKTSLKDIKSWLQSVSMPYKEIDRFANELKTRPNLMAEKTKDVISKTGICCFSKQDNNILQWSHYSDYHRGMCLKFDITNDPTFFLTPIIVEYKSTMQHYNHFTQSDKIIKDLIGVKFSDWSYENEVRILKPVQTINNNKERLFKYKNEALVEIIFGTNTPQTIINEYKDLCIKNGKAHVKFYKMTLGNGTHYELIKKNI